MHWDAVAAVGGLLGAVGIVLSVVFLAMQIRRNTAATQSQTYQSACSALADFSATVGQDPALCRVWRIGLSTPQELDDNQYYQFAFLGISLFRRYENAFYQYHAGLIDDDFWSGHRNILSWHFHRPGIQHWWQGRRQTFSKAFCDYLESTKPGDIELPALIPESK